MADWAITIAIPAIHGLREQPSNLENILMTTTNTNGRVRKSLSDQLDRLDGILDGLADGLNEAVATAVRQAVEIAVKDAIHAVVAELLTNPEITGLLRGFMPAVTTKAPVADGSEAAQPANKPTFFRWMKAGVTSGFRKIGQAFVSIPRQVGHLLAAGRSRLGLIRRFKVEFLTAVGVGTLAGVAAYFAGPWLSAMAGWLAGFAATVAVQAGMAMRRALDSLSVTRA
jgi:hypothetical protein